MNAFALLPVFLVLTALRQNVILTLAVLVGMIHVFIASNSAMEYLIQDLWFTLDRELLLSIPMFIFAGVIMSQGTIAARLVRIMTALTGPLPGGLGVAAVLAMAMFSAISGSGIVTMMAIGSLMYPALVKNGYSVRYALGVLCSGGTLGVIIPPSILMVLYGISTDVSVTDLFKAGWGPGLLMTLLMSIYTVFVNLHTDRTAFSFSELFAALRDGISAILMPVILLGGIYSGIFTVTEAAAVSLGYALVVETLIHRELSTKEIFAIGVETVKLLGTMMPIIAFAGSLNTILDYEGVPQALVTWAQTQLTSEWQMLVAVNLLLLVAGALMDEGSAIIILAPLLAPIGAAYGFDPVHFAIIMIVNLQIGYVMPPVAINVIIAAAVFKQSFLTVCKAVVPFIAIMLIVLFVVILVPGLSLFYRG
ncbi:C4-dicarboxylate transporter DctM subunit [Neorhizobium galegae]|uniref:TRAP transporter large permease n=1 Tax=Neorhizobium galegae TaxID=399 RepID=UPI001AE67CED|nr:TRAP transporter large permease [Neorhizobium galegae]MBP2562314.1 C4-dicarboxylate transporter DctM subunit [Neorhizobium galegae]MDQ0138354.1 C4-dicarboxylate transporter DctM subunit [Neorhizobium galegae]